MSTTTLHNEKNEPAKPTGRRYRSARELISGENLPSEVRKEFEEIRTSTRLTRRLATIRAAAGLTQHEMAERLRVTQGCISKWESGEDDALELRVLKMHAEVTGERIGLLVGRPLSHVEAIKAHAFAMRERLRALASLAKKHEDLECHIQAFFGEAFFNILSILEHAQKEMPNSDAIEIRLQTVGQLETARLPSAAKAEPIYA